MHRALPALSFVALVATMDAASLKSPEHLAAEVRAFAAEKIEAPRLTDPAGNPNKPVPPLDAALPSSPTPRPVLKPLFRIAPVLPSPRSF